MKHNKSLVNTLRVSAALALVFGLALTGCGDGSGGGPSGPNNNSGTPPVVINTAALVEEIGALAANTVNDTPHMYRVPAITISETDNNTTSNWAKVNTAVQNAGRFVILDLSDCTFTNNEVKGSVNGDRGMNIFKDNSYIKGIILPQSVTTIRGNAFRDCTHLTSVTIPADVTAIIGGFAFIGCAGLTSVTFEGGSVDIPNNGFPQGSSGMGSSLKEEYASGGAGTYTRDPGGEEWTKQ
ncbi:MAG: leucine-rich repeat domain-containing protein [Treponema sp.]|jgi:hypothetical protein|nr:leucine-rich repeat domain-containing protein [Treponema sp.]